MAKSRKPTPKLKPKKIVAISEHRKQTEFLVALKNTTPVKLEPTRVNQEIFNRFMMVFWTKRFVRERAKFMERYAKAPAAKKKKMRQDKYYRHEYAIDLSGACKLVAQLAFVLFDFTKLDEDLEVVSNPRHTFCYNPKTGVIFDTNMYCEDVMSMSDPHAYNESVSREGKRVKGIATWNPTIIRLVKKFEEQHARRHELTN